MDRRAGRARPYHRGGVPRARPWEAEGRDAPRRLPRPCAPFARGRGHRPRLGAPTDQDRRGRREQADPPSHWRNVGRVRHRGGRRDDRLRPVRSLIGGSARDRRLEELPEAPERDHEPPANGEHARRSASPLRARSAGERGDDRVARRRQPRGDRRRREGHGQSARRRSDRGRRARAVRGARRRSPAI